MDFPDSMDIPFRLEFSGSRIQFHANDRLIFDIEDGRYTSGRYSICTSNLGNADVHLGPVTVQLMEGSYTLRLLVEPEPFEAEIIVRPGQKTAVILAKDKEKWIIKK